MAEQRYVTATEMFDIELMMFTRHCLYIIEIRRYHVMLKKCGLVGHHVISLWSSGEYIMLRAPPVTLFTEFGHIVT